MYLQPCLISLRLSQSESTTIPPEIISCDVKMCFFLVVRDVIALACMANVFQLLALDPSPRTVCAVFGCLFHILCRFFKLKIYVLFFICLKCPHTRGRVRRYHQSGDGNQKNKYSNVAWLNFPDSFRARSRFSLIYKSSAEDGWTIGFWRHFFPPLHDIFMLWSLNDKH